MQKTANPASFGALLRGFRLAAQLSQAGLAERPAMSADEARSAARAAITEAREAGDSGIVACAIQHMAAMSCRTDPKTAAKLLGFVNAVFALGYRRENTERYTHALLVSALRERLSNDELAGLEREGGTMSELQAARLATRWGRSAITQ